MVAAWGWWSMSGNLVGRVASAATPPHPLSSFFPVTPSCGDNESVDGTIAWQAWRPRLFSPPPPFLCSVYAWPRLGASVVPLHGGGRSLAGLGASVVPLP
jgi:hypothetical protein